MIIKEQIEVRGEREIKVSNAARIIAAGVTDNQPVVWINEPLMDDRTFTVSVVSAFTGDNAPNMAHLGTIQNHGIVVHVYVPGWVKA